MRRVAGQMLQVVDLDLPAIDRKPVLFEQAGHHVLRRRLAKPRRGDLHQIGQHLGLIVELAIDLVHDLGLERCFEHTRTLAEARYGVHSRRSYVLPRMTGEARIPSQLKASRLVRRCERDSMAAGIRATRATAPTTMNVSEKAIICAVACSISPR